MAISTKPKFVHSVDILFLSESILVNSYELRRCNNWHSILYYRKQFFL
jgi:hypothetical protein